MRIVLALTITLIIAQPAMAQDTTARNVRITSTFKPQLKEAAKINFNASPPSTDTTTPRLQYNIPNQNLNFAFQPGSLRPLALQVDTGGRWDNNSYVKAGFGNLSTPYVQLGLSVGDGKTAGLNFYGKHVSSKGKLAFQDYSNTNAELNAFFQSGNIEWNARLGGVQEKYNKFGFEPKTLTFPEDSLAVNYQTWKARIGFHNINRTDLGISYSPELKVDVLNDQLNNSEAITYINLPLQKTLGKSFAVDLAVTANLSQYKPENKPDVNNNYFTLSPSILYRNTNLNLQAGVRPAWDNGSFKLFPNIMMEFTTSKTGVAFQAGWVGYLRNSGFAYQTRMNPWTWAPNTVYNSAIQERYAGFKGTIGDHFSFSAKAAYNTITNQPLFVNDTASGKSFLVVNEPTLNVFNIGGEMALTMGERFSLISNLQLNRFSPKLNDKAWGLLPLEFTTRLKIQVMKDLFVNGDLYAFDGPWFPAKPGRINLQGTMDASAGVEFKIVDNIRLWAQFNNLLNKSYQRWNQYPVYGFNFLGGVVFSFAQKR